MLAYCLDLPSLLKSTMKVEGVSNVSLDIVASYVKQGIEKKCRNLSISECISDHNCIHTWNKIHQGNVCVNWKHKWTS